LSPRWIGWGVVTLAAMVACILLGRWQLGRADESGNLQNWAYAVQWPLFAIFFGLLWWRMLRMELRAATTDQPQHEQPQPASEPVPSAPDQHVPMPRRAAVVRAEQDDPELAAYNRFLAELAARDRGD
jgi:DNA-binding transcriptional regulator of glucitol operon